MYNIAPSIPQIFPTVTRYFTGGDRNRPELYSVTLAGANSVIIDRGSGHGEFAKRSFDRKAYMDLLLETLYAIERRALANQTSIMEFDILFTDSDIHECVRAVILVYRDRHSLRESGYKEMFTHLLRIQPDELDEDDPEHRDWIMSMDTIDKLAEQEAAYTTALNDLLTYPTLYDGDSTAWSNERNKCLAGSFQALREQNPLLIRKYR